MWLQLYTPELLPFLVIHSYLITPSLSRGMPLLLDLILSNQENFPLQAHIHLTSAIMLFQVWANATGGMRISLPFLANRSMHIPSSGEIDSQCGYLPSALNLLQGLALIVHPLPSQSCLWEKVVTSFHCWYWSWPELPTLWFLCCWHHSLGCRGSLCVHPCISPLWSFQWLPWGGGAGVETVYVVVLPVSLVSIFFKHFLKLSRC